jgi:hypothetical protein
MIDSTRAQVLSPTKDSAAPYPVAAIWRSTLCEIVLAFVDADFSLSRGLPHVRLRSPATAKHIRKYIADYGETLVALSEDTWRTSEALWMGSFWDVFVDLWAFPECRSDMVLSVRVLEMKGGHEFEVHGVYVP